MNYVTVTNNQHYGGGAYSGTLYNCTLSGNAARYGGGTYNSTLYNCTIISNSSSYSGGGARLSTLYNCLLMGNSANSYGGGAHQGALYNCTVVGNYAGNSGGGMCSNTMNNCIVYFNTATTAGSNWYDIIGFTNSCTAPEATIGSGNIMANPQFVDTNTANYRLKNNSPCINGGTNGSWTANSIDLDGRARIRYGTVDMGAYERINKGAICGVH